MSSETLDRDTAFGDRQITSRRTAVAWAVLFGASTTLIKKLGTRYLMGEKMHLEWSDMMTVAVSGTLSYLSFRRNFTDDSFLGD